MKGSPTAANSNRTVVTHCALMDTHPPRNRRERTIYTYAYVCMYVYIYTLVYLDTQIYRSLDVRYLNIGTSYIRIYIYEVNIHRLYTHTHVPSSRCSNWEPDFSRANNLFTTCSGLPMHPLKLAITIFTTAAIADMTNRHIAPDKNFS